MRVATWRVSRQGLITGCGAGTLVYQAACCRLCLVVVRDARPLAGVSSARMRRLLTSRRRCRLHLIADDRSLTGLPAVWALPSRG